jgi:glutamate-5-semialdehyde dehydrogenase
LRGSKEAIHSNVALGKVVRAGLQEAGLPADCVQVIEHTDRAAVRAMLKRDKEIDVIIPRGGHGLIQTVVEQSTIPVIRHDIGNCHVYVDSEADLKMAADIAFNAKTHRPGVCNAMEHLLVHKDVSELFVPVMVQRYKDAGVEVRGDEAVRALADVNLMPPEEWAVEYLDMIAGIKVVASLDEAIEHINTYGSHHSDAIVTSSFGNGKKFQTQVDSAAVYVNASTRFTDGGQFGLGAEIGISTQKLHARGPMALEELTSVKFIVTGNGQIRS